MALGDLVKGAAKGFVDKAIGDLFGGGGGPQDGFSAQNIVSSLNKSGVANAGHFEVEITGPRGRLLDANDVAGGTEGVSTGLGSAAERDMMYRAEAAELPGRSLATLDHRFDNYAPISRVVTGQTYTPITVTFLLSEDLREKQYFETWQGNAVSTGAFSTNSSYARANPQYYHQYVGTVTIRQYGADGTLRSVHKLNEAYPYVIGSIGMNWNTDEHARLQISFTYHSYQAVFYNQNQAQKGISGGFSLGPGGLSGSLQVPGIGSFNVGGGRTSVNLGGVKKKIFSHIGL
jgi:hypothetical protein